VALQLTEYGQKTFLDALQQEIAWLALFDADGEEISGWNYEAKPVDPDLWERTVYNPGVGLVWIMVTTDPNNEPPQVVAGLGFQDEQRNTLAFEPVKPFVINETGQTIELEPHLRLFGVVAPQELLDSED
jgi:hypothetical protein